MTENKRFIDNTLKASEDLSITDTLIDKRYDYGSVVNLLNQMSDDIEILNRENQALKNHIDRNTISRFRVIDVLDCAKYDKFCDNTEVVDWIAEQLGVDME